MTPRSLVVRVAAILLSCALVGCGGVAKGPAAKGSENVAAASDLLPGDLDLVVRVDWPRLRSSPLYPRAREALSSDALSRLARLGRVLEDARALLVGVRITSDGLRADGVFVIEGDNTDFDPNDLVLRDGASKFRRLPAPRAISIFERQGNLERGEAALVAILPRRGILVASAAEADALWRTLRAGADADRLEPSARGLVSFAGRVPRTGDVLLRGPGGRLLGRISEGLGGFSGSVDLAGGRVLSLEADLFYASVAAAEKGHEAIRAALSVLDALGPSFGAIARSTRLVRRDRVVRVGAAITLDPATGLP